MTRMSSTVYLTLLTIWGMLALVAAVYLFIRPAPYGRHHRPGFGPALNARLAWLVMEAPSPLGMVLFFVLGNRPANVVALVFLALWLVHYVYRAFVYPWLLPEGARPMPLMVVVSGVFFNNVNAYLNGCWLFVLGPARAPAWLGSPAFLLGGGAFFAGLVVHVLADRDLRRLRRRSGGQRAVPTGRLFALVSCPNYAGEIVEWTGFALATWSPGALVFALWTVANLLPRAVQHHAWYRRHFPDYPADRRALLPRLL